MRETLPNCLILDISEPQIGNVIGFCEKGRKNIRNSTCLPAKSKLELRGRLDCHLARTPTTSNSVRNISTRLQQSSSESLLLLLPLGWRSRSVIMGKYAVVVGINYVKNPEAARKFARPVPLKTSLGAGAN